MYKKLFFIALVLISSSAFAAPVDCIGAYVGRISIDSQEGLEAVVLISDPINTSGSSWMNFNGWERDAKKEALSILMAAKMSKHPIDAYVGGSAEACSTGLPQTLSAIHMSTNP